LLTSLHLSLISQKRKQESLPTKREIRLYAQQRETVIFDIVGVKEIMKLITNYDDLWICPERGRMWSDEHD
jgi:hypothetical protein